MLHDALSEALGTVDPDAVSREIAQLASADARRLLARAGIRNEHVFASPTLLRARPTTLGYYRLLLGVPIKQFYVRRTGLNVFRSMEELDLVRPKAEPHVEALCRSLNQSLAALVTQLDPPLTALDVEQLPVLTLGVQLDGIDRVGIGKAATQGVFLVIRDLVQPFVEEETAKSLTLVNQARRRVEIVFGSDPDVRLYEWFDDERVLNVAIEIKGGSDQSNAHNRAGEAEKSHQKVKGVARDFWTLIALRGVDRGQLTMESPTTREWFNVSEVLAREGDDYERFCRRLAGAVGVAVR